MERKKLLELVSEEPAVEFPVRITGPPTPLGAVFWAALVVLCIEVLFEALLPPAGLLHVEQANVESAEIVPRKMNTEVRMIFCSVMRFPCSLKLQSVCPNWVGHFTSRD